MEYPSHHFVKFHPFIFIRTKVTLVYVVGFSLEKKKENKGMTREENKMWNLKKYVGLFGFDPQGWM